MKIPMSGTFSIAQAQTAIRNKEAAGNEFQGNVIVTAQPPPEENLLDFLKLPTGRPADIFLIEKGQAAPAGKTKIRQDQMILTDNVPPDTAIVKRERTIESYR